LFNIQVRMIVLLHAYRLGFSAWQTAVMFTLYEVAGVVTNLLAGLMGAKWGIKTTLLTGGARNLRSDVGPGGV
jgi:sugar phosphate permease